MENKQVGAHTQGKWRVVECSAAFGGAVVNEFIDIAHVLTSKEDAKLIAASKDMLEALKGLIDALNATEFPMNVWERAPYAMIIKLKEAKEKAEEVINNSIQPSNKGK